MKLAPTTSRLAAHLTRIAVRLLLLPIVTLLVPLVFALAWLHEAIVDLTRGELPREALMPSPVLVRVRDGRELRR
jgi:hypothetical protein